MEVNQEVQARLDQIAKLPAAARAGILPRPDSPARVPGTPMPAPRASAPSQRPASLCCPPPRAPFPRAHPPLELRAAASALAR